MIFLALIYDLQTRSNLSNNRSSSRAITEASTIFKVKGSLEFWLAEKVIKEHNGISSDSESKGKTERPLSLWNYTILWSVNPWC